MGTTYSIDNLRFGSWEFANPNALWLFVTIPIAVLVLSVFSVIQTRSRGTHLDTELFENLTGKPRPALGFTRISLSLMILMLLFLAIARPQSNPREIEVETKGRDVVFLVDVSRSMLARDLAPNRLEKAKLWINDLVDGLGNDQVGLVAFAGSSVVLSPLTTDRLFFKLALEELSPESTLVGGTNIGDAIRKTMDLVFVESEDEQLVFHRDIVLISDGEDQDSLPIEAARLAGTKGVRIISIGIGSSEGTDLPSDPDSQLTNYVKTKLVGSTLRDVAAATPGGVYLEVGTGTIDLNSVYQELIASADQHQLDSGTRFVYSEQFMYPLAAALALVLIDSIVLGMFKTRVFNKE